MRIIIIVILVLKVTSNAYAEAWGYAPDESITASEFLLRLEDGEDFPKIIEEAFNENIYGEDGVRGVCDYMIKDDGLKKDLALEKYILTCRSRLEKMLESKEYIESWGEAELIIESINQQISELNSFK